MNRSKSTYVLFYFDILHPLTSLRVAGDFCLAFPGSGGIHLFPPVTWWAFAGTDRVPLSLGLPFSRHYDNPLVIAKVEGTRIERASRIQHGSARIFEIKVRGKDKIFLSYYMWLKILHLNCDFICICGLYKFKN